MCRAGHGALQDVLSGGRAHLGAAAGWGKQGFGAVSVSFEYMQSCCSRVLFWGDVSITGIHVVSLYRWLKRLSAAEDWPVVSVQAPLQPGTGT